MTFPSFASPPAHSIEKPPPFLQQALSQVPSSTPQVLIVGPFPASLQTLVSRFTPAVEFHLDPQKILNAFPENAFDLIFCLNLPPTRTSAETLLADFQRILKPAGQLYLFQTEGPTPHPRQLASLLNHYLEVTHSQRFSPSHQTYFPNLFPISQTSSQRGLLLRAQRRNLKTLGNHFEALAPEYWNELPSHVQAHFFQQKFRLFHEVLPQNASGLVGLDVGCGIGQYAQALQQTFGSKIVGVDLSTPSLQLARTRSPNPRLGFLAADNLHLPFSNQTFDFAYTVNVLHHLKRGEQERALKEIHRVLKPNAPLLVLEMNTRNLLFRWYLRKIYPKTRRIDRGDEEFIHPDRWPLVPEFQLEKIHYMTFTPDFLPAWAVKPARAVERALETSAVSPYSIHYAALLKSASQARS